MNRKKKLIFFLIFILLSSCSFDKQTGIWSGEEKEKIRIGELEKEQSQIVDVINVYSSDSIYSKEVSLTKSISISNPKKNLSWKMHGLNHQNFLGNVYLSGIDNIFLKKKIGKNKFSKSLIISAPLVFENNIIFSDDKGTIFSVNNYGEVNWKKIYIKKYIKKLIKVWFFLFFRITLYCR